MAVRNFRELIASLFLIAVASALRADSPPNPLRLVPDQADLVVQVDHPRRLAEVIAAFPLLKQLRTLEGVRAYYNSTNTQRFYQLVGYFEKQLDRAWPDALDQVAGGGVTLAAKFGMDPAPVLVVIQGTDEALAQKFFRVGREVIDQELARQDTKDRLDKVTYRNLEAWHVGKDFHTAAVGSALLFSNNEKALHAALDLHLGGKKSLMAVAGVAEARHLLPPEPLAWMWLNMETTAHKAPQAKDVFARPRNDTNLTVLFGGWLDVAGRAPFVTAGIYQKKEGFRATIRMPRGRQGMPPELSVHVPPGDQAGALPLLEPKGVLYSTSYYLDLAKFWQERKLLFNAQQVKTFEDFNKKSAPFLLGRRFSDLVAMVGPHQRFVVAHQPKPGYRPGPAGLTYLLRFGLVVDVREPNFAKHAESILRGAALLASTQFKVKLVEEKHGDVTMIGYRLPEAIKPPKTGDQAVYDLSPCFATVGDQFLVCSTLEMGREMVDLLKNENKDPARRQASAAAMHEQFYALGGAELLEAIQDQVLTQTILDLALSPQEAQEEVRKTIALIRQLGVFRMEDIYGAKDFHLDIIYAPPGGSANITQTKR